MSQQILSVCCSVKPPISHILCHTYHACKVMYLYEMLDAWHIATIIFIIALIKSDSFVSCSLSILLAFSYGKSTEKSEISKSLLRNAIISHNYKAKKPDFL